MSARARLLSGVSTGWVSLATLAVVQIWQVRLAREVLPTDEFAVFGLISSVIASLMIAEFGIRSAFARLLIDAMGHPESDYRRFWSSTALVFAAQAFLILIAALVCMPFLSQWFAIPEATAAIAGKVFIAQASLTAFQYAFSHHSVALMAAQRFAFLNISSCIASILGALIFWWGIRSGFGLWSYIILSGPVVLLTCVVYPLLTRKSKLSRTFAVADVSAREVRRIFTLGIDLFVVALYNLALGNATLLFGGAFLPLAAVSVLTVNLKFVQLLTQALQKIPGTADPILSTMIATNDLPRFHSKWVLVSKISIGLGALCVGLSYLWAGKAIAMWTSTRDTLTGFELLLVTLMPLRYIAQMVFVLSPTMFKAANRMRSAMVVELVIYVGLGVLLGRSFGLKGILLANICSLFAGSLIPGLVLMARLSGCASWPLVKKGLLTLFPGILAASALACLLPNPELQTTAARLVWTIGWTFGIAIFYWFINFDAEERQAITQTLARRTA